MWTICLLVSDGARRIARLWISSHGPLVVRKRYFWDWLCLGGERRAIALVFSHPRRLILLIIRLIELLGRECHRLVFERGLRFPTLVLDIRRTHDPTVLALHEHVHSLKLSLKIGDLRLVLPREKFHSSLELCLCRPDLLLKEASAVLKVPANITHQILPGKLLNLVTTELRA
jgi:hypothetical protein